MSRNRACHGRIIYRTTAGEAGRETFSITPCASGRVIRAYCEMPQDRIVRDTSWSLDGDGRPVEGHVRITLADEVTGSSWYYFTDDGVDCESFTGRVGRVSQHLAGRRAYLGLHPVIGDGLIAAVRGTDEPGVERIIESVTCSYSANGETELLALPISIGVTYVGEERLTVTAGMFDARRYALNWQPQWPPADLWVMGDECVFLKLDWSVSQMTPELTEFSWSSPAA